MTPEEQQAVIENIKKAIAGRKDSLKILLVEDSISDAEITLHSLKRFGLSVEWCRNSIEVVEILHKTNFWLIFLDLKLEGHSGLNVLTVIKSMRPEAKIVVLTGQYQHDSAECKEALKLGAIAVMLKPLTDEQVQLIFGTP